MFYLFIVTIKKCTPSHIDCFFRIWDKLLVISRFSINYSFRIARFANSIDVPRSFTFFFLQFLFDRVDFFFFNFNSENISDSSSILSELICFCFASESFLSYSAFFSLRDSTSFLCFSMRAILSSCLDWNNDALSIFRHLSSSSSDI